MLTTKKQIGQRLMEACDVSYFDSLHAQMEYAFGKPWAIRKSSSDSALPWYPSISMNDRKIGQSKRIASAALLDMARVMFNAPEPVCPDVEPLIAEVRKQYWLSRYMGDVYHPKLYPEYELSYLEGIQLGIGFVEHGVRTNLKTGLQYCSAQHSPAIYTLTDRHNTNPSAFTHIAFVKHYAPEVAKALYKNLDVEKYTRDMSEDYDHSYKVVRIIEYYDLGFGEKGEATRAVIPGDITDEPLEVTPNPFGCLPFSYCVYHHIPGMDRPIGRILLQMATQEARNELEDRMRKTALEGAGKDLVNLGMLDDDSRKAYQRNPSGTNTLYFSGGDPGGRPPFERIQDREVSATLMNYIQLLDRELNADSGSTDFDRGSNPSANRTLGENQLVDARSAVPKAWSRLAAQRMMISAIEKTFEIAKIFDTDKMLLDVYGDNIAINDPTQPASAIAGFLEEPSRIMLDTAAFEIGDSDQKMLRELQLIDQLGPLIGPVVDPYKVAEEKLLAMNKNPRDGWISVQTQGPVQGTAPNPNIGQMETNA